MNPLNVLTPDEQALLSHYRQLVAGSNRGLPEVTDDFARLTRPNASGTEAADAYVRHTLRIDLPMDGWYSQGYYWDNERGIGSPTIRFELAGGGYWEHMLDRPERFGKLQERFKPGMSLSDCWWCPPGIDLQQARTLHLVEGIFDAIVLARHSIAAVAIMTCHHFPKDLLAHLAPDCALIWSLGNDQAGLLYARKHASEADGLGFSKEAQA